MLDDNKINLKSPVIMSKVSWKISTCPDELTEGLFGQIVLWIFEILPYLHKKSIYPSWDIKSKLYGTAPDYTVIPGVFDLAYTPSDPDAREFSLVELRNSYTSILGGDWDYLHKLWNSYFKIPERILIEADRINLPLYSLGIHYRGNDKNQCAWDTNPVSQSDFLTLVTDFLKSHQEIESIFVATDEFSFVEYARQQLSSVKIINLGEVNFHKANINVLQKGDRALLDCVLLSRCKYLIKCSSALSGFAKILNPDIESYRVSASKLFCDNPYFPEAYIPKLTSEDPECMKILEKQFVNDWLDSSYAKLRFGKRFKTKSRYLFLIRAINSIKFKQLTKFKRWLKGVEPD